MNEIIRIASRCLFGSRCHRGAVRVRFVYRRPMGGLTHDPLLPPKTPSTWSHSLQG
jgi:hypothetical protein